ncbi:thiol:disulfide interchange protein DsbA/DsbL [Alkalimonas amylolytica]|uniref:Thiol:disulfide interchange protein n=1 Tax=Alkalimonas amylolytica TaxID=152573 RepID=A0A1H4DG18_ALKAM|nr:thiol:disulfide interchange protein DsbA/DsbL [Alkalimonas amylolytica]SEA71547.1 thiol:disulfide interchange protein DsbA [Alkalimonas amylolytica]
MKLQARFFFLLLLTTSVSAWTQPFQQGRHYDVIASTPSAQPEVKEYFSYYCGACAAIEPFVQTFSQQLPEQVRFRKVMWFMAGASTEIQQALEHGYLAAVAAGDGDAFSTAVFNRLHSQRAPIQSAQDVRNLALQAGIDAEIYDGRLQSFSVRAASTAMRNEQSELARQRVVSAVPTFVVNGKYRVNNNSLNPRNYQQELEQLLTYLLSKTD